MPRLDVVIIALRVTALFATVVILHTLWRVMIWLPWQVDCLIAAASSCAFAYRFDRGERS